MLKGVGSRIVSLVWQNLLISSLHVCSGITMSTQLLMLKVVCIAAGRRINSPLFKQKESELKKKCDKAGVEYEGPRENEDYLLGSVEKEEKERTEKLTNKRRKKLKERIKRGNERTEKTMNKGREVRVGALCDNDPNKRQQQVCAVCNTTFQAGIEFSARHCLLSFCPSHIPMPILHIVGHAVEHTKKPRHSHRKRRYRRRQVHDPCRQ